jgi:DNA-3-methyladenine glycosylase II
MSPLKKKTVAGSARHRKAVAYLKKSDPVLAEVIAIVGACRADVRGEGSHLDAVMRSIIFQQLSGQAAGTIHRRFKELYGGESPTPKQLARTSDEKLRAIGLSRQKAAYLKDLAEKVLAGECAIESLHELEDAEIIAALTAVKGIGRWTAQMFLMFRLGRPDVLPDLDLGIQKAIKKAYGLRKHPTPERVLKIGAKWAPYRTVASWYLWRLLDTKQAVPRSSTS